MKAVLKPAYTPLTKEEIQTLCTLTTETTVRNAQAKKFGTVDLWNIQRGRKNSFKRTGSCIF